MENTTVSTAVTIEDFLSFRSPDITRSPSVVASIGSPKASPSGGSPSGRSSSLLSTDVSGRAETLLKLIGGGSSRRSSQMGSHKESRRASGPGEEESVLKAYQRSQFYRTRMCPHFVKNGRCRKGNRCNYAHDERELQPSVNLTKTTLCDDYMAGCCKKSDDECDFAHGVSKLRSTAGFYKTQLCKFWIANSGVCPAGNLCRHAHGDAEWPQELQSKITTDFGPNRGRRMTDFGELLSMRRPSGMFQKRKPNGARTTHRGSALFASEAMRHRNSEFSMAAQRVSGMTKQRHSLVPPFCLRKGSSSPTDNGDAERRQLESLLGSGSVCSSESGQESDCSESLESMSDPSSPEKLDLKHDKQEEKEEKPTLIQSSAGHTFQHGNLVILSPPAFKSPNPAICTSTYPMQTATRPHMSNPLNPQMANSQMVNAQMGQMTNPQMAGGPLHINGGHPAGRYYVIPVSPMEHREDQPVFTSPNSGHIAYPAYGSHQIRPAYPICVPTTFMGYSDSHRRMSATEPYYFMPAMTMSHPVEAQQRRGSDFVVPMCAPYIIPNGECYFHPIPATLNSSLSTTAGSLADSPVSSYGDC